MSLLRHRCFIFSRRLSSSSFNPRNLTVRSFTSPARNNGESTPRTDHTSLLGKQKMTSTVLYRRDASRTLFPRALLSFSTLHTGYWVWYVTDFVSSIEASTSFSIDKTVGYVGLSLAAFMSIGSIIYPMSLVQEISFDDTIGKKQPSLKIRTYQAPLIFPSSPTEYKLRDIVIDSPRDVTKIMTEFDGDIGLYNGYLPLHAEGRYINLLLQISQGHEGEIHEKDKLLHSLVPRKLLPALKTSSTSKTSKKPLSVSKRQSMKLRKMLRNKQ
mmetsp:Transcript_3214/g.3737  ORF Transcript_3214/g.3737 Transcript_3214/m.3737 type:complete len:270 (+) Transcript_3214:65-874(+)